jgi:glycine/D-amino acid oxidase-like deaminating enzyme
VTRSGRPLPAAPLRGRREADVIVLGDGVVGKVAALELAERGRRVAVVATAEAPSAGLDLGHVLVGTGRPYSEEVRRRGRETARALWEVHRENHERLRAALARLGDECGHHPVGGFLVAADRKEAEALAESEDALRDDGFSGEFLDHYMLGARFDAEGFAGAYWAVDEGEVDGDRLGEALTAAAAARGAVFFDPGAVLEVELSPPGVEVHAAEGEVAAALAVLAAEAYEPRLEPWLSGRTVPLEARGLVLGTDSGLALPTPARMVGGGRGWRLEEGELRLAGWGADPDLPDLGRRLGSSTRALAPARATFADSPDGMPWIGLVPGLPAAAACGFGRLVLAYAMVAAHWAVDALLSGRDAAPAIVRASRPRLGSD